MHGAIAPSTRATYAATLAEFLRWRERLGRAADKRLSAAELVNWISELADAGNHKASTLRVYATGLGFWFDLNEPAGSRRSNPNESKACKLTLRGIERAQSTRRLQQPMAASKAKDAQPLLYTALQKLHFGNEPRERMYKAAAFLGVSAALRPGELLSVARSPQREQFKFYADYAATAEMKPPGTGEQPRALELTLRITKTTQNRDLVKIVTAADAVAAVWRWYCDTADRGPAAQLFRLEPTDKPPTSYALVKSLERRHKRAGLGTINLTGKSLRMGGASTLAVQGLEASDIAALAWAPGSQQWQTYARDPLVQRQRAIQRSNLMQLAAAPPRPGAPAAAAANIPQPERRR